MESLKNFAPAKDSERVEIFVSCRKLKHMEFLRETDPFVKCYVNKEGRWVSLGETEIIRDNLNPNFSKTFIHDFQFEVKQKMKFEVIDCNSRGKLLHIGDVYTTLGELVGAKNQTSIFDIVDPKNNHKTGKLILRIEQVRENRDLINLQLEAHDLHKCGGLFGSTHPSLSFFRSREDGAWVLIHRTEMVKGAHTPSWKEFSLCLQKLCNGDRYRPIKIECTSGDGHKEVVIGEVNFCVQDVAVDGKKEFKLKSAKFKDPGTIIFRRVQLIERAKFLDYIRGGVQLSVTCAIDYTSSNGAPTNPKSLHALRKDGQMNEYQRAIHGVCEIVLEYDHDETVALYGFGGVPKFPMLRSGTVNHCFPCTGNPATTLVNGLQGIMETYKYALEHIELSGPTYFSPVIIEVMKTAQEMKKNGLNEYMILLILTDGEIHDMENTINQLLESAKLPLSIIVVGIGHDEFEMMEKISTHSGLMNSEGVRAVRDIVQFVPFRKFEGDHERLAEEVLRGIPTQLEAYMEFIGKKPDPPRDVDISQLFHSNSVLSNNSLQEDQNKPKLDQNQPKFDLYQPKFDQPSSNINSKYVPDEKDDWNIPDDKAAARSSLKNLNIQSGSLSKPKDFGKGFK